ncbi:MAG: tetratricopeptide repeat protein, partial [Candidatus Lutibacillus vidarii]
AAPGRSDALVVTGADATFQDAVSASLRLPVVVVLWSGRLAQSVEQVDAVAAAARRSGGRFQVVSVDIDTNPGLRQAFAVERVPMTVALLQGQPIPLFLGALPDAELDKVVEQLLTMAVQNGITGRIALDETPEPTDEEAPLPAHIEAAYAAIEADDLETAAAIYETALATTPGDEESRVGLGQVRLLQRTRDLDPRAVRATAAERPDDVAAQIQAADLDLVGGHVEDAFARLVDTVRATSGAERTTARDHLLALFDLVGASDARVTAARRALMSALF